MHSNIKNNNWSDKNNKQKRNPHHPVSGPWALFVSNHAKGKVKTREPTAVKESIQERIG
jgi:hypothetical protein